MKRNYRLAFYFSDIEFTRLRSIPSVDYSMRTEMKRIAGVLLLSLVASFSSSSFAQNLETKPTIPIGLFFASIEEGGRIFTPVRLLPFSHPESEGHQFPNALQLYGTELDILLWLGHEAGYELRPTLMRYPKEPSPTWPYAEFAPPDTSVIRATKITKEPPAESPLKGLRAVFFMHGQLISFIVDTRNLSLEERGMKRATSMGLDLTRAEFLERVSRAAKYADERFPSVIIFLQ